MKRSITVRVSSHYTHGSDRGKKDHLRCRLSFDDTQSTAFQATMYVTSQGFLPDKKSRRYYWELHVIEKTWENDKDKPDHVWCITKEDSGLVITFTKAVFLPLGCTLRLTGTWVDAGTMRIWFDDAVLKRIKNASNLRPFYDILPRFPKLPPPDASEVGESRKG